MLRPGSCTLCGIGLLVSVVCLTLTPLLLGQGFTGPPPRKSCVGGDNDNKFCKEDKDCPKGSCKPLDFNNTCPPCRGVYDDMGKLKDYIKIDPDASYGDKQHGRTLKDYFLGEWKFVEGDTDLVVRFWCVNGGPRKPSGAFGDFYAYELATSTKGTETTRIPPAGGTAT
jgi:hypothetical protein